MTPNADWKGIPGPTNPGDPLGPPYPGNPLEPSHTADYVRWPEATVDDLRVYLESLVLDKITSENPGIDRMQVAEQRLANGQAWTARSPSPNDAGS
jgi:hypothetical protein